MFYYRLNPLHEVAEIIEFCFSESKISLILVVIANSTILIFQIDIFLI